MLKVAAIAGKLGGIPIPDVKVQPARVALPFGCVEAETGHGSPAHLLPSRYDAQAVAGEWVDAQLQMVLDLKDEALAQMSNLTSDPELATQLLEQAQPLCH